MTSISSLLAEFWNEFRLQSLPLSIVILLSLRLWRCLSSEFALGKITLSSFAASIFFFKAWKIRYLDTSSVIRQKFSQPSSGTELRESTSQCYPSPTFSILCRLLLVVNFTDLPILQASQGNDLTSAGSKSITIVF